MPMPNKMTMMTDSGSSNKSNSKVNNVKTKVTTTPKKEQVQQRKVEQQTPTTVKTTPKASYSSNGSKSAKNVPGATATNWTPSNTSWTPSTPKGYGSKLPPEPVDMSIGSGPAYKSKWTQSTVDRKTSPTVFSKTDVTIPSKKPSEYVSTEDINSNAARLEKIKLKTSDNNKASSDLLKSHGYYLSNMVGNNIKNVEYVKNTNLNEGYASIGGAKVKLNPKYINNESMVSGIAIKDSNGKVLDYYVLSNATFDKNKNKYYYSGSHNGVASGVYADDIENWLNKNYYNSDGTVKNGLSLNLLVGNKSNEKSNSYDITPMAWINEDSIELNKETNKNASNSNLSKSEAPKKVALGSAGDFKQNYGGYNMPLSSSVNKAASVNGATATNWDFTKSNPTINHTTNTITNGIVGNTNTIKDIWNGNNKSSNSAPTLNPNITPLMQYSAKQTGLQDKAEGLQKVKEFINNTSTQVSKVTSPFSEKNAIERRVEDVQKKLFTNSKLQRDADQLGIFDSEVNKVKKFIYGTSSQAAGVVGNKEKQLANIKAIPDIVSKNPKNTTPGKDSIGKSITLGDSDIDFIKNYLYQKRSEDLNKTQQQLEYSGAWCALYAWNVLNKIVKQYGVELPDRSDSTFETMKNLIESDTMNVYVKNIDSINKYNKGEINNFMYNDKNGNVVEYTPKPGDFIFMDTKKNYTGNTFQWDVGLGKDDNNQEHTGMVIDYNPETKVVTTLEGNIDVNGDDVWRVYSRDMELLDSKIVGYGSWYNN